MLGRECDPSSKLPTFMQKNVTSRLAMTKLSQKMLEENNFMSGRFCQTGSCFDPKSSKRKKEDENGSFQIDDFIKE